LLAAACVLAMPTNVTLTGDETVSIARSAACRFAALRDRVEHVDPGSNDYADAAALTVIADLDSAFDAGANTIKMTQNALSPYANGVRSVAGR